MSNLLTLSDLAKKLAVSAEHVRRMRSTDRIPAPVRLGRVMRWDEQVIDEWIALAVHQ